jgi:hypothetical protein
MVEMLSIQTLKGAEALEKISRFDGYYLCLLGVPSLPGIDSPMGPKASGAACTYDSGEFT